MKKEEVIGVLIHGICTFYCPHLIHNMQGACHHLEQREHREQLALPPKGERVAWIEAFFYLTIPLLEQLLTLS